jgi:methionyl-tRNA synthetase
LVERHDSDLANDLGNLWQRSVSMIHKFNNGQIPAQSQLQAQSDDPEWHGRAEDLVSAWRLAFDSVNPRGALSAVWDYVGLLNKSIDSEAPWALAKNPNQAPRLKAVLARLAQGLALVSALFWPVMPTAAENMWKRLGLNPADMTTDPKTIRGLLASGQTPVMGPAFFPRIADLDKKEPKPKKAPKSPEPSQVPSQNQAPGQKPAPAVPEGLITIEEFKRLDLRVAKIEAAERVPKSEKLIKLTLSLGQSQRTVLAGIGKHYAPEELVGRLVVIVANLVPAKLMGQESQGMVLAASDEGALTLVALAGDIAPGAKVS